jgi:hypothetical protein
MKMIYHKNFRLITALSLLCICMPFLQKAAAQAPHSEEITVIAPYEPTLPDVFKINIQPRIETETSSMPPVSINITPRKLNIRHSTEPVQEATPPVDRPKEIFRNHIRGGFGNYLSPYVEFNAGSLRNDRYHLGIQARHLSSHGQIKDYGHSSYSDNMARISAKRFFDRMTLGAKVLYKRNVLHHYGFLADEFPDNLFNTSKDDIRQRFNNASAELNAVSNNRNREGFHYNAKMEYGHFSDLFETSEHRFNFETDLQSSYMLFRSNDKQSIGLKLDVGSYRTNDSVQTLNNTIIQAQPYIRFSYQEYEILAGVNVGFDADTANGFKLFPVAEGRLKLLENRLAVFMGVDGNIRKNSFYSLATDNPFIHSVLNYENTVHKLRFYGGLQGSAGKRLDYKASISNSIVDNMALFINDTSIAPYNRFIVIYDDMNLIHGNLSATYSASQQLRISSGIEVFHYSPDKEDRAWHKPAFRAFLESWYNYSEKLAFRGSVNANGKSWAKIRNTDTNMLEEAEIKSWLNISLGATYQFNDQLHFFADVRNLTAGRHFYWYNYPGQRLQVMAGAGFSF